MTTQIWLITGGAGYIGSHVADAFLSSGKEIVIYDSLYQGLETRVEYLRKKYSKEIPFVVADIRDSAKFDDVLTTYKPFGIIHTAALKAVGESMDMPDEYFEVNLYATTKILELAQKHAIKNFIFSSTAAVYGAPDHSDPIKENDIKNPISPYGASKLAAEDEVSKFVAIPGNHGTSLRFFNVVGTAAPELLDNSVTNLVPIVINNLKNGEKPVIFGTDYPTPDGTCIRDFVHVMDLADGHSVALENFKGLVVYNLGTGKGSSVFELVKTFQDVNNVELAYCFAGRREGDVPVSYANVSKIYKELGWKTKYTLEDVCKDGYNYLLKCKYS